jgi:hypothetical protein
MAVRGWEGQIGHKNISKQLFLFYQHSNSHLFCIFIDQIVVPNLKYYHKVHDGHVVALENNNNKFPLCSSTAFKLNLDESTKSLNSSRLYIHPSSCRSPSASLQLTNMPSLENNEC